MDRNNGMEQSSTSEVKTASTMSAELAEWLFGRTLDDLERRIRSTDAYDRLGIAHLLRRLLMDQSPVLHSARRRLALPLPAFSFDPFVLENRRDHRGELYLSLGVSEPRTTAGIEDFLAAPVGELGANPITVRDLVRHVAHVEGGVHLGSPSSPLEWYLRHVLGLHDEAREILFDILAEIATVVVHSLTPMRERLTTIDQPE